MRLGFKGVKATKKFSIHPGPNSPVGVVWIDLSIPSYGIHGTPEPEGSKATAFTFADPSGAGFSELPIEAG
jgi:hypothetical protein